MAVGSSASTEPPARRRRPERWSLQIGSFQCGQRDESGRTGYGRYDEPMQAGEYRAREYFPKRTWLSLVRSAQSSEIPCPVALVDDGGREAEPNEDQIEDQSPSSTIAIEEGMDLFKSAVGAGQRLGEHRVGRIEGVDAAQPRIHLR